MIIDVEKLQIGIGLLRKYLTEGIVTVTFTKKDGTERVMRCTQKADYIPDDKKPKPHEAPSNTMESIEPVKEHDPQLFKVWDLEVKGWRSFRYTTIKTMYIP